MFRNRRMGNWSGWLLVLAATALITVPTAGCLASADTDTNTGAIQNAKEMGNVFAEIAKKSAPAVVFVRIEKEVTMNPAGSSGNVPDFFGNDFFRRFFGHGFSMQAPEERVEGQGSGFIVSKDGYILTNNHVVAGADKVKVSLADGREFDAKVVGTDPGTDIAVIRIDAKNLPTLPLGESDKVEVGEWVLALGNPFGLSNTLTAGIVSAKGRSRVGITDYEDFIQTDAAINPGNSGGPLIDLDGNVIGINTAIATRTGSYMGVGFAIPITLATDIERQIIDHGSVVRGYLGVVIQDLSPQLAESMKASDVKGIVISEVQKDSPADHAGLEVGDIITGLDGKPVQKVEELRNQIAMTKPGTRVELTLLRDGETRHIRVEIGRKEGESGGVPASLSGTGEAHDFGFKVQNLTGDLAEQLGYVGEEGVVVTDVDQGSVAEDAGLQRGMLIEEVDRQPIKDTADFRHAMEKAGDRVLLLVRDKQAAHFVVLSR